MDKIYFGNKVMYLNCKSNNKSENTYHFTTLTDLKTFITDFDSDLNKLTHAEVIHSNIEELRLAVEQCFTSIPAAGGFVKNFNNEVLIMFRRGKWDLPKGKIDTNETPEVAALREVEEETGLDKLLIRKELGSTYHTYWLKGKHILKRTYWYEMKYVSKEISKLSPQIEEDITEVKWLSPSFKEMVMKNTYPSIVDVFKMATL